MIWGFAFTAAVGFALVNVVDPYSGSAATPAYADTLQNIQQSSRFGAVPVQSLTAPDASETAVTRDTLGDAVDYLTANLQIKVEFLDGKAVGIELPQTVELTVIETEPGLKSATASSVTKPAKTETGLVVQVPPFINEGEKIRVDTAEGVYLSRA